MINNAKNFKDLKDDIKIITLKEEDYNTLIKDRWDFGFNSIYFRYAIAIDELAAFKEKEYFRTGKHFDKEHWANINKTHFYGALERLMKAHEQEDCGV